MVLKLNRLSDTPGASKKRVRRGRGIGSGLGKTAGRGHKGQKARSGVAIKGHEGGQMPLHRRLPKRGFRGKRKFWQIINLGQIQSAIDVGCLSAAGPITELELQKSGILKRGKYYARILADGILTSKIVLKVPYISENAARKIEDIGGVAKVLVPQEIESRLPSSYKSTRNPGELLTEELVLNFDGGSMNIKTTVDKDIVKRNDKIKMSLEISIKPPEAGLPKEYVDQMLVHVDGFGVNPEMMSVKFSDVLNDVKRNKGVYRRDIEFVPNDAEEIKILISLTYAGNILGRKSHILRCEL